MALLSFGAFNLRFFPARTPSDWLSRDPAQVDRYLADPWCGFTCSAQFWVDQLGGMIELEAMEKDGARIPRHLPVLMFAGTHDPVSRGGKGIEQLAACYRRHGAADVKTRLYPKGRHEMLNETSREQVYADVADWLLAKFPRRGRVALAA
jgi:alpha-beta hydrolase superfamily lysophospholipase